MDALQYLRSLPDKCVNSVATSPPYYDLRDYQVEGQIGNEQTPQAYVDRLIAVFSEINRVLADDGTIWVNLGDTYQNKQLLGIPWRVAFALQDTGYILRSEIIWYKTVCLPESVKDRPSRVHETIFLFSKTKDYYYDADAIREPYKDSTIPRMIRGVSDNHKRSGDIPGQKKHGIHQSRKHAGTNHGSDGKGLQGHSGYYKADGTLMINPLGRNKKSVWSVPTKAVKEAHFATFPPKLIEPMILAGCPKSGVVLDPFMGSGTTALTARRLGRHYLGCDLNPEYVAIAHKRLSTPYMVQMF